MGIGSERSAQRSLSFWWPYSAVSMSTTCHAGPTAYHPRSPTNETIGLVCMPDQLHTIYCHWPMRRPDTHAMPDQLHTIYFHKPMRRLDPHAMPYQLNTIYFHRPMRRLGFLCLCHAGPTAYHLLSPTNEKTGHVRASCNRFTVNDQWEGCAKSTIRRNRAMRRMQSYLSMLCSAHCFLSIASNEKTRCPSLNIDQWEDVPHIYSHRERPSACKRTLHSCQPMRKLHSSHLKCYWHLSEHMVNQPNSISSTVAVQSQVKSTKPYGKNVLRIVNYVTLFYSL